MSITQSRKMYMYSRKISCIGNYYSIQQRGVSGEPISGNVLGGDHPLLVLGLCDHFYRLR